MIIRYSCFTNGYDTPVNDGRLYVEPSDKFSSRRMNAKMSKILPHLFLPDHEWSIWVDANIELLVTNDELIKLADGFDCMVFVHPFRKTIIEEITECSRLELDSNNNLGYHSDKEGPLSMCGVIVRRNTDEINSMNERWWAEICRGSSRDQLSFPYTLGRLAKQIDTEFWQPHNTKYFNYFPHLPKII